MRGEGGFLTLTRTTFTYNFFEVGMISNLVVKQHIDSATISSQYTTSTSKTCNSYGRSYSGDCFSITVTSSIFSKFNKKKYKTDYVPTGHGKIQGMFLALVDFNGLIKISGSTFYNNLATLTQYRDNVNKKFDCYPIKSVYFLFLIL